MIYTVALDRMNEVVGAVLFEGNVNTALARMDHIIIIFYA